MAEFKEVMKKYHEMCTETNCRIECCPIRQLRYKFHLNSCFDVLTECSEEAEEIIMAWEKPIDWTKVPVDTKILVRDEDSEWMHNHFAKYENGNVYTWLFGGTSWTTDKFYSWKYAKLAEEKNND